MLIKKLKRVCNCQYDHLKLWLYRKYGHTKWVNRCPVFFDKLRYEMMTGKSLDCQHPKDLNQKLFLLNHRWCPEIKIQCADKYRMHEYLSQIGCSELSVPILGVWESEDQIPFDELPNRFVLKCNHGCGYNIICRDKKSLNIEQAKMQLSQWLLEDYSLQCGEHHYHKIKPLIIAEEFLDDGLHDTPQDFKVYCFNGKIEYILVCSERQDDGSDPKFAIYSKEWKRLPYVLDEENYNGEIKRPDNLELLLNYAEKLARDFIFVRLDFYLVGENIYLGEFTFTPQGNFITYRSDDINVLLGKNLSI